MTQAEIEKLIQTALEPLKQEIVELREKLSAFSPQPSAVGAQHAAPLHPDDNTQAIQPLETETSTANLEPLPSSLVSLPSSNLEPSAIGNLPSAERKDFQRFLQRGLEEEQVRYSEEAVSDKPETKKGGWNPFRR